MGRCSQWPLFLAQELSLFSFSSEGKNVTGAMIQMDRWVCPPLTNDSQSLIRRSFFYEEVCSIFEGAFGQQGLLFVSFFLLDIFFACRGMFFVEKAVVSVAFSGFFGHVNTQPSAGDKMPQAPLVRFSSELF